MALSKTELDNAYFLLSFFLDELERDELQAGLAAASWAIFVGEDHHGMLDHPVETAVKTAKTLTETLTETIEALRRESGALFSEEFEKRFDEHVKKHGLIAMRLNEDTGKYEFLGRTKPFTSSPEKADV